MERFISLVNDIVWNPALVGLLLFAGFGSKFISILPLCPQAISALRSFETSQKS